MQHSGDHLPLDASAPTAEIVPGLLRFLRVVRYRRRVIFASVAAALLAGGAYFALATRLYDASAKLLIIQQNQEQLATIADHDSSDATMATHRELVKSPIVVRRALEQLRPEHRIDLEHIAPHKWVEETAAALSAKTTRNTNFIEVSYASRRPEAAAAMVSSVIQAYLEFVRQTHKGAAGDAIEVLTQERNRVQASLDEKHRLLRDDRQRVGQLAMPSSEGVVEPIVQRAIRFNDALLAAQEKRLELQAMYASVAAALGRGEDISQYLVGLESVVGREMLLAALGLSHHDQQVLTAQQQRLQNAETKLRELAAYYGPNHPQLAELEKEVAATTQFLSSYHANVSERFSSLGAG